MGWHRFTKKIGLSGGGMIDPFQMGNEGLNLLGRGMNWLDGTDAARKQMAMQDQYNMKYWNLQNEYNLPANQMARFKDAGLNPNLIYGQTNTAGAIGSVSPGHIQSGMDVVSKGVSMLSQIYGIRNMQAQNTNLEQQTNNLKAQEGLATAQSSYIDAQKRMQDLKNIYFQTTGRLPREEGVLGSTIGDLFRYADFFSQNTGASANDELPPKGKLLVSDADYQERRDNRDRIIKKIIGAYLSGVSMNPLLFGLRGFRP